MKEYKPKDTEKYSSSHSMDNEYTEYLRLRGELPEQKAAEAARKPNRGEEIKGKAKKAKNIAGKLYANLSGNEEYHSVPGSGGRARKSKRSGEPNETLSEIGQSDEFERIINGSGHKKKRGGILKQIGRKGRSFRKTNSAGVNDSAKTMRRSRSGKSKLRRICRVVLILFCAFMALLFIALTRVGDLKIDRDKLSINDGTKLGLITHTNIAVFGVDSRDMKDDSGSRSDAIVVMSIDNIHRKVRMFSVYRDTLLDLGKDTGLDKVTHAYYYGGAQQAVASLNRNLDLDINKAVVINWKSVADLVDSLGGIKINVRDSELDEINHYVGGTAKAVGSEAVPLKSAGMQTLNGAQAVTYARIRKDAARGDYRRNERMKTVMKKTFKKMKKAGPLKLLAVSNKTAPEIRTNMSALTLLVTAFNFKLCTIDNKTRGWPYRVEGWTGNPGNGYAWYGPPKNLANNVSKLHAEFFGQKNYTPSDKVKEISDNIMNVTGVY